MGSQFTDVAGPSYSFSAVEFNGQNRVFVSQADASLAFYESINPSEAKNAPYNLQQITDTNGVHIKAYSQLPLISGVAYGASACNKFNNDTVRIYYIATDRTLKELVPAEDGAWKDGTLNRKQYSLSPTSGLSAVAQNGELKIYCTLADEPHKISIVYTTINNTDWTTRKPIGNL